MHYNYNYLNGVFRKTVLNVLLLNLEINHYLCHYFALFNPLSKSIKMEVDNPLRAEP